MERLKKYLSNLIEIIIKYRLWGIGLALLVYSLLFPSMFSLFSKSSINFYLVPAIVIGYFYGPVWGLVMGLLFWPLHALLFSIIGVPLFSPDAQSTRPFMNFWTTYLTAILTAVLVGYLQKTRQKLEHEIVKRKRISAALRQSEQRYRVLMNHSSNVIVLFDHQGVIEYITPSAERLLQFPVQEITGKHFSELIHPDWRLKINLFYARQIVKKTLKSYKEFPLITKSGKTIWVAHVLELLFDEGEVTGGQGVLMDISSRQEAQQALTHSEQRFRALTENSTDVTIIIDQDKIVKYISPSIHNITGFTEEEVINQDIRQFVHPEDQTKFIQRFQEAIASPPNEVNKTNALQIAHKDGRWLFFDGLIINMLDIESVNGIVLHIREITSRVEMEKALWESEYNFRTLFNQAHDAVVILSIQGKVLEYNHKLVTLLNLPQKEITSRPFTKFLSEEDTEKFNQLFEQLKTEAQVPVSEIYLLNHGQEPIPVEINLGMVKNSQGEPQKILGILRDISAQKQTEEKLRHLATHDPLTKTPNRDLFYSRLQESCNKALESGYRVAVAFLDYDNFKLINDEYGHHIGDLVLQKTTENIQGVLRTNDTFSRFGGDEFTIMLEGIQSISNVENIIEKVAQAIATPLEIENNTIQVEASIGISIFPDDGDSPDVIIQNADKAMYAAKDNPEENINFFHQIEAPNP